MTQLTPLQPETRLRGGWRWAARAIWLALVAPILLAFGLGLPVRFNFLRQIIEHPASEPFAQLLALPPDMVLGFVGRLGPSEAAALTQLGISMEGYASFILAWEILLGLVCFAIGLLIVWRRSDDWLALVFSALIILVGAGSVTLIVPSLARVSPFWNTLHLSVSFIAMLGNLHLLFLSPDGHLAPRWAWPVTAGISGYMVGVALFGGLLASGELNVAIIFLIFPGWLLGLGLGVYAQIWRYRQNSTAHHRQQSKWVAIGLAATTVGFLFNGWLLALAGQEAGLPRVMYSAGRTMAITVCMMLFPICVAFSVFRYRLWDIDVIIRRTLQYSVLSGLLGFTYFGLVVGLQGLTSAVGGQRSEFITVLSTLAIAALFFPLRNRVQEFIDKRFYRKKYDAQKVLAEFAATCRDETDLDKLVARLAEVIDETLQPEKVSVWIKPAEGKKPQ